MSPQYDIDKVYTVVCISPLCDQRATTINPADINYSKEDALRRADELGWTICTNGDTYCPRCWREIMDRSEA